jgi:hypothetical protein
LTDFAAGSFSVIISLATAAAHYRNQPATTAICHSAHQNQPGIGASKPASELVS